jgi:hypothetical protein
MSKCCISPASDIVAASKTDKTCKMKPANLKVFNTYILNKYQNSNQQNNIVLDDKTKKALGKEAVNSFIIM